MDDVFQRLVIAAKQRGVEGHKAISDMLNESPQVITNWSKRGVPRGKITKIAGKLNVSTDWLLTGRDDMALTEHPLSRQEQMLLDLFRDLTDDQRAHALRALEDQKQQNDRLWEQLSKIRSKKAS